MAIVQQGALVNDLVRSECSVAFTAHQVIHQAPHALVRLVWSVAALVVAPHLQAPPDIRSLHPMQRSDVKSDLEVRSHYRRRNTPDKPDIMHSPVRTRQQVHAARLAALHMPEGLISAKSRQIM